MMNIIEMFRLWISIPKSIYYNIKVFPFSVWKKFPLLIDWNSHVKIPRGGYILMEK